MNPNILVIGGTGFLGSAVVSKLEREGVYNIDVIGYPISDKLSKSRDIKNIKYTELDLISILNNYRNHNNITNHNINNHQDDKLVSLIKNSDIVISFIGKVSYNKSDIDYLKNINYHVPKMIFEYCFNLNKPLIYTSSAVVLGECIDLTGKKEYERALPNEIDNLNSTYILTKYLAENEAIDKALDGLNITILRPGSLLGIGNTSSKKIIDSVLRGITFELKGGASLVSIEDVANAYLSSLDRIINNTKISNIEIYNLGGENIYFMDFIDRVKRLVNKDRVWIIKKEYRNLFLPIYNLFSKSYISSESLNIADKCFFVNSDKAKLELNYNLTPIDDVIMKIIHLKE